MPKIEFRGKEYETLADMSAQERHDYFKAKAGYDVPEQEPTSTADRLPGGMENVSGEVGEIYKRVRGKLDAEPVKTSPVDNLPTTEELYRRSAPEGMQGQPSDEVIYQPSPPIIEPPAPIVQSDYTLRRLVTGLLLAGLAIGVAMAVLLFVL